MRRVAAWLAVAVTALAAAAPAHARQLITWHTDSRHVDPDEVQFNGPPPGGPDKPPGLRVNVLLPDGYDGHRRFPVLFLLHGHGDRYDYWANKERGDVRRILGEDFPAIVIMPEAGTGWYTNWWNGGDRSPAWERYHLDELIPLVEHRLKVRQGRRWHAVVGLSMGGEGAMFYASQRPRYFGSAASFSGVLSIQRPEWPTAMDTQGQPHLQVFGDPDDQRFYWTGHNPTALVDNLRYTRLLVRVGDGVPDPTSPDEVQNTFGQVAEIELRQHANDFVDAAQNAGVDVTYQPHQGIHDWPYWRRDLAAGLDWGFFKDVPSSPDSWTYATVAREGEMWGLRFRFREPPDTLEQFERDGRTLSADGSGEVVIRSPGGETLRERLPFSKELPRDFFG